MSTFKQLIWNLTDFEFLASLESVDFHNKTCLIKKNFFNTLIGLIKQNVNIETKRDLQAVIGFIKSLYLRRLGLVSPHSMVRFFERRINLSFGSFYHRVKSFFKLKTEKKQEEEKPARKTKAEKRREQRARRKLRKAIVKNEESADKLSDSEDESNKAHLVESSEKAESESGDSNSADNIEQEVEKPIVIEDVNCKDCPEQLAEDEEYEEKLQNLEIDDLFIQQFGVENFEMFRPRVVYEEYLEWKAAQDRINYRSSDEEE